MEHPDLHAAMIAGGARAARGPRRSPYAMKSARSSGSRSDFSRVALEERLQAHAFDELGHEERLRAPLAEVVDLDDVRMTHAGRARRRARGERVRCSASSLDDAAEDLHRDQAAETARVLEQRAMHGRRRALPEHVEEARRRPSPISMRSKRGADHVGNGMSQRVLLQRPHRTAAPRNHEEVRASRRVRIPVDPERGSTRGSWTYGADVGRCARTVRAGSGAARRAPRCISSCARIGVRPLRSDRAAESAAMRSTTRSSARSARAVSSRTSG